MSKEIKTYPMTCEVKDGMFRIKLKAEVDGEFVHQHLAFSDQIEVRFVKEAIFQAEEKMRKDLVKKVEKIF